MDENSGSNDQRLRKKNKITESARIRFLRMRGQRFVVPPFVVYRIKNEAGLPRVAVSLTRKAASSVGRNLAKRQVREVFRKNKALFGSFDYFFFASRPLLDSSKNAWKQWKEKFIGRVEQIS